MPREAVSLVNVWMLTISDRKRMFAKVLLEDARKSDLKLSKHL